MKKTLTKTENLFNNLVLSTIAMHKTSKRVFETYKIHAKCENVGLRHLFMLELPDDMKYQLDGMDEKLPVQECVMNVFVIDNTIYFGVPVYIDPKFVERDYVQDIKLKYFNKYGSTRGELIVREAKIKQVGVDMFDYAASADGRCDVDSEMVFFKIMPLKDMENIVYPQVKEETACTDHQCISEK